jgi:Family of unknown function (DUF5670)
VVGAFSNCFCSIKLTLVLTTSAVAFSFSYTMGGFIHILLVLAVVAVLIQLISGRRVV